MGLHVVIATGLFSLGGVFLGGLLAPLTQLFLERKRERRAADRAKLLVATELLQAQLLLRAVSKGEHWPLHWPLIDDVDAFLPTSAWRENRSSIAGMVSEELWSQIVIAYGVLEADRYRFVTASKLTVPKVLTAEVAKGLSDSSKELGRLRWQLGLRGGWLDEIEDKLKLEP